MKKGCWKIRMWGICGVQNRCSGGFGGWFWGGWGGGLGVLGKFLVIFGDLERYFSGFRGLGKIWRCAEGF